MRLGRRLSSGIAEDPPAPAPAREEPAREDAPSTATVRTPRREPATAER